MLSQIQSCSLLGIEGQIVTVEIDVSKGLPAYVTVGLPDAGVKESKERVYSAIKNNGYQYPMKKITINLAPADLKKEGPAFDLPIALGLLLASEQLEAPNIEKTVIVGELSLSGEIKPIGGILPMVLAARDHGFESILIPEGNRLEASVVEHVQIYAAKHINEALKHLSGEQPLIPCHIDAKALLSAGAQKKEGVDFCDIRGQENAKRALEIAAAGAHNLLMSGPPGAGKSMMAKAFPSILPDMTMNEALEITKIYSVAGLLEGDQIMTTRPFRAPHHTISNVSLVGGGRIPKPGEVSLAHLGVLFLDELPEFQKSALEVLRQPIEDKRVTISRINASLTYPASFMMVASMNPCPCGYYGDPSHECRCTDNEIRRYAGKISGPLLDRIDIKIEVPAMSFDDLEKAPKGETSRMVKNRVNEARIRQNIRYEKERGIYFNAQLTPKHLEKYCQLGTRERGLMEKIYKKMNLSARGYHRILKLARTIADLGASETITLLHLSEAVQYRGLQNEK